NLWDDPYWGTRCAFTSYLPPFDMERADARAWSVADALWWAQTFDIDGYRLDAIKHVPLVWLEDLRRALRAAFPTPAGGRFYLVGETFAYDDRDLLRRYVNPERRLDGQFDFPLKARLCEAIFRPEGSLESLAAFVASNDAFYGVGAIMTTWIGNHDIPRAIHFASREIANCREGSSPGNGWSWRPAQPAGAEAYERLGLAFAILMTGPGIPLVYYGDEIGLAGGGDPDNRRMMPWDDGALLGPQRALRSSIAQLARIRGEHRVLSRGRRVTVAVDRDTWVYRMTGCGPEIADVVVAINRADETRVVTLPEGRYQDLRADVPTEGGRRMLPPRSWAVFRAL
ncbi:MAG: alpha-amylase family glycosyl hydrolase, partial [Myxococcales bacterium]|nr:alpha-amylase family glycosyl hydrolase [Myxococcales bacterium]